MKNVLCTGGCGFIGRHLVRRLVELKTDVTIVDDLSTGVPDVPAGVHLSVGDISSSVLWNGAPEFDTVFHLAAISRIGASFANPDRAFEVNVRGTSNVMAVADRTKARVVFASTSCCTGDVFLNPYARTKAIGESLVSVSGGVIARLFNVYGPDEPEEGPSSTVVARFAKARRDGRGLVVHGDGSQRRDFVHVADVVEALVVLCDHGEGSVPYEVGTGTNYSILEVAKMFKTPVAFAPLPPGQLKETRADTTRLRALGWEPKYDLPNYVASLTETK